MTETLLKELAEQIVREQVLLNWRFWFAIGSLLFVATAGSSYLSNFFSRKAQNKADLSDHATLLDALKKTPIR